MPKENEKYDPFFGLKYIAYCRARLHSEGAKSRESMVQFAKWQICKSRNLLFNDPIWESYTEEEIFIEFFTIRFDDDEEAVEEFETAMRGSTSAEETLEWMEKMEKQFTKKDEPQEFEDNFE